MADDGDTCGFRINKDYAKKYNLWREKEEQQKLKDRYGNVDSDEDSSSSESEDEDAEGLTAQLEKDWFRTYAALKSKDPKIYDKNIKFYHSEDEDGSGDKVTKTKPKKPVYLKDYERNVILQKGGIISESSDEEDHDIPLKAGYYEEQEEIKKSFANALAEQDSDSDELLVERAKSKEEKEKEEHDYLEWLKGQKTSVEQDSHVKADLEPLKELWSDPKLDSGQKFLRDYILNKAYLEEDHQDRVPTYEEVVLEEDLSADEEQVERQETFERKFNFRFEEPDPEFIKSYPRTVGESVRRKDDRRAKKRKEVQERKEKEKQKKREEIKQLKNMKRKEILSKIDKLKQITGNDSIGISQQDIDGDFDPKEYDKLMKKVFDEDYYDDEDAQKPVFQDDDDLGIGEENWDDWTGGNYGYEEEDGGEGPAESHQDLEPHCEDPDFNMDADYDPEAVDRSYGLDGRSQKKKKSKFKQAIEKKKPRFDPNEKTFEEYFDEYYKLDYEDMIGDLPCRFKYRSVQPCDYGLTVDEILKCNDKELNQWVSLKKMSQHRTMEEERYDMRLYAKKSRNLKKKLNILPSLQNEKETDAADEGSSPGSSKKKKGKKRPQVDVVNSVGEDTSGETSVIMEPPKKKKKKQMNQKDPKTTGGSEKVKKKPKEPKHKDDPAPSSEVLEILQKSSKGRDSITAVGDRSQAEKVKKKRKEPKRTGDPTDRTEELEPVQKKKLKIGDSVPTQGNVIQVEKVKKKKKKKLAAGTMSDERLKAFGINPRKFKYTHLAKFKEIRKGKKKKIV